MWPTVNSSSRAGRHTDTRRPFLADTKRVAGKSLKSYERRMLDTSCHGTRRNRVGAWPLSLGWGDRAHPPCLAGRVHLYEVMTLARYSENVRNRRHERSVGLKPSGWLTFSGIV